MTLVQWIDIIRVYPPDFILNYNNMSVTSTLKELYEDAFYEWVADNKYNEACDYCDDMPYHQDDDFEKIQEYYFENMDSETKEKYWSEFLNTKEEL